MAVYDGSDLRFTLNGKTVYHATNCSITVSRALKERATKDTNGTEVAKGIKSWSGSGEGLAVMELPAGVTTSQAFEDLFDAYNDDTDALVDVELTLGATGATGDTYYKGKAIITELSLNAPNEEDATASFSITGSGVLEKDTVA
ncbi:hypothetical protein I5168_11915 [Nonlabens sp. SCSIO 43208]|uniref:phage tail tube protein n=1 Tax=Nonlabens sp. SCSIO 43208 TaxID=2793009 RepID=UPI003D6AA1AB